MISPIETPGGQAARCVLVTGGTRGIGKGIAQLLAEKGNRVIITGRNRSSGQTFADRLTSQKHRAAFLPQDLSDLDTIPHLVRQAQAIYGRIDTLVHAAGIYPTTALSHMTLGTWRSVVDVNLTSLMLLTRELLPDITTSGNGRVVAISSITGPRTGFPELSHYAASKGGLEAFIRTAALELASTGTTVNAVAPGTVLTESLEELYSDPETLHETVSRIPLGRIGKPSDIAHVVNFLLTTAASFITGQSITVDGGQTLPEVQG